MQGVPCLDDLTISNLIGDVLPAVERVRALAHLDECTTCYELVAAMATGSTRAQAPARLAPGTLVGRYEVERVVGAGAMGVVYAARDHQLDRTVALKLVAGGGDRDRIGREARAMAQLSHRNVVAVFDVGTVGGDVFFAMELIAGQTLRTWLASPRTPREMVAVMLEAGRGLAAAHAAGIVHRDFKPENVLIADDGRVCVTDFGLARAEPSGALPDQVDVTSTGQLLGTPVYMAPEVLAGSVADAASDQFSFCVVLYEGLTGQRPFTATTISALREAMQVPPRTVAIPHLQRLLARGLDRDPAKRFAELPLAELAHDPAAQRRRFALGAVVVAIIATAIAVPLLHRADPCPMPTLAGTWDPHKRGQLVLALAPRPQPYIATTLTHVNTALDHYGEQWVSLRRDACQATYTRRDQSEARYDAQLQCLDRRRLELAAVVDLLVSAPETETVRHAQAIVDGLSDPAPCKTGLADQPALPANPAVRGQVELVIRDLATAHALARSARYVAAQALDQHALAQARLYGYTPALGDALLFAGKLQAATSRDGAAAERSLQEAATIAATSKDDALAAQVWMQLAYSLATLSQKLPEADAMLKVARTAVQRAGDAPTAVIDWYIVSGNLAMAKGELDPALQAFREGLKLAEVSVPTKVADLLGKVAAILDAAGKYDEARTFAVRALDRQIAELGPDHPEVAFQLDAIGGIDYDAGHYADAHEDYRRSFAILERLGEPTYNVTESLEGLGNAAHALGNLDEARTYGERVLAIREQQTPDDPHVADAVINLGSVLADQGHLDLARASYDRGLAIYRKAYGPAHPMVATALLYRARTAAVVDDRIADLDQALRITVATLGPEHPSAGVIHGNLGGAYSTKKDWKRAADEFEQALAIQTKTMGADHPMNAIVLGGLGQALYASGEYARAIAVLERALTIPALPDKTAIAQLYLGRALWDSGRDKKRAVELVRTARAAVGASADSMSVQLRTEADQWLSSVGSTAPTRGR